MQILLKPSVFLAQSDTTAGFFGTDSAALNRIKHSPGDKPLLQIVGNLHAIPVRVPQIHRNFVRRSRASCIYPLTPPRGYRVVKDTHVQDFLRFFGVLYSTSANLSGMEFDADWARTTTPLLIEDKRGIYRSPPSAIFKLSRTRKRRLR
ncbi:L-threonylcarbamoyladenylate synthase [Helicobacter salomonis]|uniref:N6-threonylcarbamoyl adenosine t(6)A37 modification in tRNA n=1 Tax=Helicobacter salomonis TaxID=56878 RepID=UPI000CF1611E|nr:N6-threonylcarbamoyl adenosine t(6)A37 modification in tRNA [Helicobacter salomonis]